MMSKFSARNISVSLRSPRKTLQLASTARTGIAVATLRSLSTSSRLTPLFGTSNQFLTCVRNARMQIIRSFASLPEHKLIGLPALSPTMETGAIVKWQKKEGEQVAEGDLLCEIETDKSVMAFESSEEGYLAKILMPDGTKNIPLGKPICVFVENESDVAAFKDFKPEGAEAPMPAAAREEPAKKAPAAAAARGSYPEHIEVPFPALSPTMETGKVVTWHKKVGDQISEGDMICEIETDKSVMAFEINEEGYLAKIILPEGSEGIKIGQPLCVICKEASDVGAFADYVPTEGEAESAAVPAAEPSHPPPTPTPAPPTPTPPPPAPVEFAAPTPSVSAASTGGRVVATPYARKLASEMGVDLSTVQGTGPGGRIIAADVEGARGGVQAAAGEAGFATAAAGGAGGVGGGGKFIDIPVSNMRATIAKRLMQSKLTVPHYYLTAEIVVDDLLKVREKINERAQREHGVKVSVNDFVIKATALACKEVPQANSMWMEDKIRQNNTVDISVAVSTDSGLITPIIFNADGKGVLAISQEVKNLAQKARENKLQPNEYLGGTFTISNLGMYGCIDDFCAIINPPQACILAIGGAEKKCAPDGDRGCKVITTMRVTLSCDHRVVDGAVGAQWLKHFKDFLETPDNMLL